MSWIGEVYLEANAPDPTMAIGRAEFLESWKDLLPESWRREAMWDNLKVCNSVSCASSQYCITICTILYIQGHILKALYVWGYLSKNGLTKELLNITQNDCYQYPDPARVCFKPRAENKATRPGLKKRA